MRGAPAAGKKAKKKRIHKNSEHIPGGEARAEAAESSPPSTNTSTSITSLEPRAVRRPRPRPAAVAGGGVFWRHGSLKGLALGGGRSRVMC